MSICERKLISNPTFLKYEEETNHINIFLKKSEINTKLYISISSMFPSSALELLTKIPTPKAR